LCRFRKKHEPVNNIELEWWDSFKRLNPDGRIREAICAASVSSRGGDFLRVKVAEPSSRTTRDERYDLALYSRSS